jgi:hypothetical protein
MKPFFRMTLLLGTVGLCYGLGRRHGVETTESATAVEERQLKKSAVSMTKHSPAFAPLAEVRDLLTNPKLSWKDKEMLLFALLRGDNPYNGSNYYDAYPDEDPLVARLPKINPADIPDLLKLVQDLPTPLKNYEIKNEMLEKLFGALAGADPATALPLIDDYPYPRERPAIIAGILGRLAASDPQQAMSYIAQLPPNEFDNNEMSSDPNSTYTIFFNTWASEHPAEAAAAAQSLPPGIHQEDALKAVGETWADNDPQAAMDWAKSLPPGDVNVVNEVASSALYRDALDSQMGKWDLPTAVADLNAVTDLSQRDEIIANISGTLAEQKSYTAALDWLNQTATGVTYDEGLEGIFGNMSQANAVAALNNLTDPEARAVAIDAMASHYGDTSAALAWAQALPDSDSVARTDALNTILENAAMRGYNATDLATAAAFVQNVADPSDYPAFQIIAQQLAATNPQAALAWVMNLPLTDGRGRGQALMNVSTAMSLPDLATAWNNATSLPEDSGRDQLLGILVAATAMKDPAQAVSLVDQLPAGTAQTDAISDIAQSWARQDPQAFTVWLNGLPAGDGRDAAVAQLVGSGQTAKDPAAVLAWANTVSDPQTRADEIGTVLTAWAEQDATAALNAAQTVNLPAAQLAALIQKLTPAQTSSKQ